jgi:phosphatidate cytidylyltransferase
MEIALLKWRLIIGGLLASVLAAGCLLDARFPGLFLGPLALLLACLGADEIFRLAKAIGSRPGLYPLRISAILPVAGSLLPLVVEAVQRRSLASAAGSLEGSADSLLAGPTSLLAALDPLQGALLGSAAGVAWLFAAEMRRVQGHGKSLVDLAVSCLGVGYLGTLLAILVALRQWGGGEAGLVALASVVLVVKASDIGQYAIGRWLGKHKLAPRLSPGKTWEGFAGGIAASVLMAAVGGPYLLGLQGGEVLAGSGGSAALVLYGIVLAVAGVFGDLAESLLKREAQLKDSSDWMPGFGGVLDLLDSLLFAGPVAYLVWRAGWVACG